MLELGRMSAAPVRHQATIFLPGHFEEGRFASPRLPAGLEVRLGGLALKKPQKLIGEGTFSLWPRTNIAGEIIRLTLASRLETAVPESEVCVRGALLRATSDRISLLIQSKGLKTFRVHLRRGPGLTAHLVLNRLYQVEGRVEEMQLIAERAQPLEGWPEIPKEPLPPLPPAAKKPTPPPAPKRPAPAPPVLAELPPALHKGQQMGLTGSGPYYLVLSPPAVPTWWPKVERRLSKLAQPHSCEYPQDALLCRWQPGGGNGRSERAKDLVQAGACEPLGVRLAAA